MKSQQYYPSHFLINVLFNVSLDIFAVHLAKCHLHFISIRSN